MAQRAHLVVGGYLFGAAAGHDMNYLDDAQCRHIEIGWPAAASGLRCTARAMRVRDSRQRKMQRLAHHDLLGAFYLNHPPVRRFEGFEVTARPVEERPCVLR